MSQHIQILKIKITNQCYALPIFKNSFDICVFCGQSNLWIGIFSFFFPHLFHFILFPFTPALIPLGCYILCKHIINFFQIWNWVKIFHSQLNVSFDSMVLKIISSNHLELVSLSQHQKTKIRIIHKIILTLVSVSTYRLPPVLFYPANTWCKGGL